MRLAALTKPLLSAMGRQSHGIGDPAGEGEVGAITIDDAATKQAAAPQVDDGDANRLAAELAELKSRLAALEAALAARQRELEEAQAQLAQAKEQALVGQFTPKLVHDMRGPLGTVRTSLFVVERKTKDLHLGLEKPMTRIKHAIERGNQIITDLMELHRLGEPQFQALEVDGWLEQSVREISEGLPDAVTVELHRALADTVAQFDPEQLNRLMTKLLRNAAEAMVGELDEPVDNPTIIVSSRLTARGIEISVRDNGPGICDDNLEKVREPLFTTKDSGIGLGLTVVESIAKNHGGGLEIDGGEGTGAAFTFWFPLRQAN